MIVNNGEIIELEITSSGMDGEGVARRDGKVVFVPYTLKGERVRAVVKSVKKNFCNASVIKVLSPSEHRVTPFCPHYYKCGGCDTQHIDADYRRRMLIDDFGNNLKKIAGLDAGDVRFCAGSRPMRNKTAMPFGLKDGKTILGYYKRGTHEIVGTDCPLQSAMVRNVCKAVCDFADEKRLPVYDERSGKGLLRHIAVREIGGRAAVAIVINGERFAGETALAERLPRDCDLFVCKNTARGNVIMGDSVRKISGNDRLAVNVLGVQAELSPLSFFQVNDEVRDMLYADAIGAVSSDTLIDLYSGIGITSNLAAKKCDRVFAVECVPQAVRDADRTAELNGNADRITNICGAAEKELPKILSGISGGVDVLIDPPRKGCERAVIDAAASVRPRRLVYISCNHATMCRDIKVFTDKNPDYEVKDVALYDMFCCTHHAEAMIVLQMKN